MKDKPFNQVVIEHLDAQALEPIHQNPAVDQASGFSLPFNSPTTL